MVNARTRISLGVDTCNHGWDVNFAHFPPLSRLEQDDCILYLTDKSACILYQNDKDDITVYNKKPCIRLNNITQNVLKLDQQVLFYEQTHTNVYILTWQSIGYRNVLNGL